MSTPTPVPSPLELLRLRCEAAERKLARLTYAVQSVRSELEEHFDTVDGESGPGPNWAMRLADELDHGLGRSNP